MLFGLAREFSWKLNAIESPSTNLRISHHSPPLAHRARISNFQLGASLSILAFARIVNFQSIINVSILKQILHDGVFENLVIENSIKTVNWALKILVLRTSSFRRICLPELARGLDGQPYDRSTYQTPSSHR